MKAKPQKPDDRRVRRTRRALRDALVRLVVERGWEHVSVQDVCDEADVGRSTFYVHFADKENLLLSAFDDLHASMRTKEPIEPFGFLEPLFEHARQNVDLYRAVAGRNSGAQMLYRFQDVLAGLVADAIPSTRRRRRTIRFISGGIMDVLRQWVDDGCREQAEELAEDVRLLATRAASDR